MIARTSYDYLNPEQLRYDANSMLAPSDGGYHAVNDMLRRGVCHTVCVRASRRAVSTGLRESVLPNAE